MNFRRVELLANVSIIAVAFLLSVVLIKNYIPLNYMSVVNPSTIATGTKLPMPEIDWSKSPRTMLVVLQKGCHFCSESAQFYQKLAKLASANKNVRVIAVLPQSPVEGKAYLDALGVPISEVKQASLNTINVRGTPTLILTNDIGVITNLWVGKLSADKESEVLSQLE